MDVKPILSLTNINIERGIIIIAIYMIFYFYNTIKTQQSTTRNQMKINNAVFPRYVFTFTLFRCSEIFRPLVTAKEL